MSSAPFSLPPLCPPSLYLAPPHVVDQEFETWLREVKKIPDFNGPKWELNELFSEYCEDYNCCCLPHEKCVRSGVSWVPGSLRHQSALFNRVVCLSKPGALRVLFGFLCRALDCSVCLRCVLVRVCISSWLKLVTAT